MKGERDSVSTREVLAFGQKCERPGGVGPLVIFVVIEKNQVNINARRFPRPPSRASRPVDKHVLLINRLISRENPRGLRVRFYIGLPSIV